MQTEKALALVVRGTDWSETSRITTLFTREFGRIRVLAKGGRRLRSNFDFALDLLTVCRIVFIRKSTGGLDLLTEAQAEEKFPVLRQNLAALNVGYYLAELLSDGTQDYDPHPALFDTARETLHRLGEPGSQLVEQICRFELAWLAELGYTPRLDACAMCGRDGPFTLAQGRVAVSPEAGGVLCPACGPAARDRRSLSAPAFEALSGLVRGTETAIGPALRGELRGVLGHMVCFILGRRPRLLGPVDGIA